jgi:hypothetical protein
MAECGTVGVAGRQQEADAQQQGDSLDRTGEAEQETVG